MSINLTDEIEVKTKKGKLGAAKQIFLEGDTQTVENEIQYINSRHNDLNSKHESLSSTVSEHTNQIESNQNQITANKSTQDAKNASLDANMAKLNTRDDQITELVRGITATGGASVATTVTYDNTSSHLASATVQGAIDELQGSKIDKTSILQELGNAEDKVVSQKCITNTVSQLEQEQIQVGVYDVSSHNDDAVFESLQALLSSSNLNTLIPPSVRHGGMSIKFIQGSVPNSDNKYVQYRLMATSFGTTESDWQGVDEEPTPDSDNLVKSGGVKSDINKLNIAIDGVNIQSSSFLNSSPAIFYNVDGTTTIANNGRVVSGLVPVKKEDKVEFKSRVGTSYYSLVAFDSNKAVVPASSIIGINNYIESVYIVPDNINYVQVQNYSISSYPECYIKTTGIRSFLPQIDINKSNIENIQSEIDSIEMYATDFNKSGLFYKVNGMTEHLNPTRCITGLIKVQEGERVSYNSRVNENYYALVAFNSNKELMSSESIASTGSVYLNGEYIVPSGVAYIQVQNFDTSTYNQCYLIIYRIKDTISFIQKDDNSEFLYRIEDSQHHLLAWVRSDGVIGWSKGVPEVVKEYIHNSIKEYYEAKHPPITINPCVGTVIDDAKTYLGAYSVFLQADNNSGMCYATYGGVLKSPSESTGRVCLSIFPATQPEKCESFIIVNAGDLDFNGEPIPSVYDSACLVYYENNDVWSPRVRCIFDPVDGEYLYYRDFNPITKTWLSAPKRMQCNGGDATFTNVKSYVLSNGGSGWNNPSNRLILTAMIDTRKSVWNDGDYIYTLITTDSGSGVVVKSDDNFASFVLVGVVPRTIVYEGCISKLNGVYYIVYRGEGSNRLVTTTDFITYTEPVTLPATGGNRPWCLENNGSIYIAYGMNLENTSKKLVNNFYRNGFDIIKGSGTDLSKYTTVAKLRNRFGMVYMGMFFLYGRLLLSWSSNRFMLWNDYSGKANIEYMVLPNYYDGTFGEDKNIDDTI